MFKQIQVLIGFTGLATLSLSLLPHATAQITEQEMQGEPATGNPSRLAQATSTDFQGRGVSQGSAFTRGRTANALLTVNGNNFGLELAEPPGMRGESLSNRARVQYRGAIIRQNNGSTNSGSFTLDGRIRSFNSSANLRAIGNTTGTCRIEVFDSRVISSSCRAVADDSTTQFLGLEQF